MRLEDRVVVVTGACGGIGLCYAQRLAGEGAAVVLADLHADSPEAQALLTNHSNTLFVRTDVRSPDDANRLASAAEKRFGRIDVLINNAALFTTLPRRPFEEIGQCEWRDVLDVNVLGPANCTRAVAADMKRRRAGKIINIASNVAHKGLPLLLHYVASKGAVIAMTRALARELGPSGITVNAVAPGYVLHAATSATDAGRNERVVSLRSLARTQTPDDLTGAIVFLASNESDFITGQTIVVDGGEVFA